MSELLARAFTALGPAPTWRELELVAQALRYSEDADALARSKPRGWRIEAPDRSSNVDGVVALMMALDRFENQPEPVKLLGWL